MPEVQAQGLLTFPLSPATAISGLRFPCLTPQAIFTCFLLPAKEHQNSAHILQRVSFLHHDDSAQANMGSCKGWRGARWPTDICPKQDDVRKGSSFAHHAEVQVCNPIAIISAFFQVLTTFENVIPSCIMSSSMLVAMCQAARTGRS